MKVVTFGDVLKFVRFGAAYTPFPGFEETRQRGELGLAFGRQIVPAVDGRR